MPEPTRPRPLAAADLWELERVGAPLPAADGSLVIVPVTTYDVEANERRERLDLVRPRAARAATASEPAPPPAPQVFILPLDGGEARRLTDFPLGAIDPHWLPDGRRLVCIAPVYREAPTLAGTRALAATRRRQPVKARVTEDRLYRFWDQWLTDGKVPHLFVVDAETGAARDLTPASTHWFDFMEPTGQFDIAPDGREVVFAANASAPPHDRLRWALFALPIDALPIDAPPGRAGAGRDAVRCLTPDHPADDLRPRYSPDGRFILYGMQREWDFYADRVRLVLLDRTSGESAVLTEDWDRSAGEWEFTPDGATIVFTAEDRGRTALYRLPASAGGGTPQPLWRNGTAHAPRATAGGLVYFQAQTLGCPPEILRCPLAGGRPERVTRTNDALLAGIEMGTVEELEVTGAGGEPVQVWLVYPPGFDPGRRWPLVHLIHGGPHGVFGDQFHFRWNAQTFAAAGYVVALVNFHGSTSFGQDFAASILGSWGDQPLRDIMAATDALIARGVVDPERMAIAGGSYGGYLTAWLASQTDRFACAVCHAGVIDFGGMYAGDITQGRRRAMGGTPWEDRVAFERWSPASFAAGFATPMLVIHGEHDYRVPATQGLELYGILKAMQIEARLVVYPDENHWIQQPQNSLHWYGEVLGWLGRFLDGGVGSGAKVRSHEPGAIGRSR